MADNSTLEGRNWLMRQCMLNWDFEIAPADALAMSIRTRETASVRISEVAGRRCEGTRNARHVALDGGDYFGIVCTLEGTETCSSPKGEWHASSGDVMIWRNVSDLNFRVEDWFRKIILLVPAARFHTVLRQPIAEETWTLPGTTGLGALISSFMIALASNLERLDENAAESAVEMTLDLVGSAINTNILSADKPKRSSIYKRTLSYIDHRLEDVDLTPSRIAETHGISTRYLHLIFAENGGTVSGYIRERRLLRCCEELELRRGRSLTEIAHDWGFCDGAHFSRAFKKRFGLPPKLWRTQHGRPAASAFS